MEETSLAKIASEALKPFSVLIDAMLGPKILRIKNWAEKQDLNNRLGSIEVNILLDQYMKRLLSRVSGITTIVFPQQVLPLTSIYEPLRVYKEYGKTRSKNKSFSVKMIKPGNNYLIVDSAGMGKSTYVKHLVLEIFNLTEKIPVFLELRRINDSESLLGKIAEEIDANQKDIDERLLLMLLDIGGFVIILDGYDELPERLRINIGRQISELAIRSENNSVILTSRPEVDLPEIPKSTLFKINPLTVKQAKSLILRYDAVANIDIGKRLILQFDKVSGQFLQTPLLVVLLYRTFGFNNSIATRITAFYDEIFNAMYKGHDLSKAGFAREKTSKLDSEDFRILLRGFSFLLMVRQKDNIKSTSEAITIIEEASKLTSVKPSTPDSFLDDLLISVPLLIKDGTDYRFIHKSIGEYFSAEYLAYTANVENTIESIKSGYLSLSFINSFQFLSEINLSLFRRIIVAPIVRNILSSKNPIKDLSIQTICLISQVDFGLWPYDKYTKKFKGDEYIQVTIPDDGYDEFNYYYGKLKKKRYIFSSRRKGYNNLPYSAWQLITKEFKRTEKVPLLKLKNFAGLYELLGQEQWVSIDDERVVNNANHPVIRHAIDSLLEDNFLWHRDNTVDITTKGRIIDEKSCREVFTQIQQELETQNWLEALIKGNK